MKAIDQNQEPPSPADPFYQLVIRIFEHYNLHLYLPRPPTPIMAAPSTFKSSYEDIKQVPLEPTPHPRAGPGLKEAGDHEHSVGDSRSSVRIRTRPDIPQHTSSKRRERNDSFMPAHEHLITSRPSVQREGLGLNPSGAHDSTALYHATQVQYFSPHSAQRSIMIQKSPSSAKEKQPSNNESDCISNEDSEQDWVDKLPVPKGMRHEPAPSRVRGYQLASYNEAMSSKIQDSRLSVSSTATSDAEINAFLAMGRGGSQVSSLLDIIESLEVEEQDQILLHNSISGAVELGGTGIQLEEGASTSTYETALEVLSQVSSEQSNTPRAGSFSELGASLIRIGAHADDNSRSSNDSLIDQVNASGGFHVSYRDSLMMTRDRSRSWTRYSKPQNPEPETSDAAEQTIDRKPMRTRRNGGFWAANLGRREVVKKPPVPVSIPPPPPRICRRPSTSAETHETHKTTLEEGRTQKRASITRGSISPATWMARARRKSGADASSSVPTYQGKDSRGQSQVGTNDEEDKEIISPYRAAIEIEPSEASSSTAKSIARTNSRAKKLQKHKPSHTSPVKTHSELRSVPLLRLLLRRPKSFRDGSQKPPDLNVTPTPVTTSPAFTTRLAPSLRTTISSNADVNDDVSSLAIGVPQNLTPAEALRGTDGRLRVSLGPSFESDMPLQTQRASLRQTALTKPSSRPFRSRNLLQPIEARDELHRKRRTSEYVDSTKSDHHMTELTGSDNAASDEARGVSLAEFLRDTGSAPRGPSEWKRMNPL